MQSARAPLTWSDYFTMMEEVFFVFFSFFDIFLLDIVTETQSNDPLNNPVPFFVDAVRVACGCDVLPF